MKKVGLIAVGLGTCFLLAGCQSLGGSSYEEKHYENDGNIQILEIADDNMKINVVGVSSDQPISINYYERKNETYTFNEKSNKVSMKKNNRSSGWNIFSIFNWNTENIEMTVEVPENQLDNLMVKTENGKILLANVAIEETNLKTTNGKLEVQDSQVDKLLKLATTNGKVELENVKAKDVTIDTTNAKILFNDLMINNSLKAETTNGKISGTIDGNQKDFAIDSQTTNGKNSLGNTKSGSKQLKLKTTNGAIDVDFNED